MNGDLVNDLPSVSNNCLEWSKEKKMPDKINTEPAPIHKPNTIVPPPEQMPKEG